jgi:hypothetical protein
VTRDIGWWGDRTKLREVGRELVDENLEEVLCFFQILEAMMPQILETVGGFFS